MSSVSRTRCVHARGEKRLAADAAGNVAADAAGNEEKEEWDPIHVPLDIHVSAVMVDIDNTIRTAVGPVLSLCTPGEARVSTRADAVALLKSERQSVNTRGMINDATIKQMYWELCDLLSFVDVIESYLGACLSERALILNRADAHVRDLVRARGDAPRTNRLHAMLHRLSGPGVVTARAREICVNHYPPGVQRDVLSNAVHSIAGAYVESWDWKKFAQFHPMPPPLPLGVSAPSNDHQQQQGPSAPRPDAAECVVCMDAPQKALLFPCGHADVCLQCANTLLAGPGKCHDCRARIERVVEVFR